MAMVQRPSPDLDTYLARRRRISARLHVENAALVLYGGELATRAHDTEFRFRPDSDMHYLCGLEEPGAVVVLTPGKNGDDEPTFTVFVRPRDSEAEVWSGRRIGPEGAVTHWGADAAHPISSLDDRLPALLDGRETVYLPIARWPKLDAAIQAALTDLRRHNRDGKSPPRRLGAVADLLGEDRVLKDDAALASLRRAIDISVDGHLAAMRQARPGMWEYEIEAILAYEFRRRGSTGPGYGSIVGAGDNATILHYVDNCAQLGEGDVLLVDAGAEWDYFSGDITRSWPVSGAFTGEQRAVYEAVLAANIAGIEKATVGSNIDAIHEACVASLCSSIAEIGLLDASADEIRERALYKRFYMHKTSHWLGVDVHDAGRYTLDGEPRPLAPRQVLTVEPGLYIARDTAGVADGFRGLGVRIEDDVLITEAGPEILSAKVPKSVAALEDLIGSAV